MPFNRFNLDNYVTDLLSPVLNLWERFMVSRLPADHPLRNPQEPPQRPLDPNYGQSLLDPDDRIG